MFFSEEGNIMNNMWEQEAVDRILLVDRTPVHLIKDGEIAGEMCRIGLCLKKYKGISNSVLFTGLFEKLEERFDELRHRYENFVLPRLIESLASPDYLSIT